MAIFDLSGNTGGANGTPSSDVTYPSNWFKGAFNILNSAGQVILNVPLNSNGQAIFPYTLGSSDVGQNNMGSEFLGNPFYSPGNKSNFNLHVADKNGNISTKNTNPTVTQIVAGPGIYISAPNGQGVVTISTKPIDVSGANGNGLYSVCWTSIVGDVDGDVVGQFMTCGDLGIIQRSRDGHNWTTITPTGTSSTFTSLSGIAGWANNSVDPDGVEYWVVGQGTELNSDVEEDYYIPVVAHGANGNNNDAPEAPVDFRDQNGAIGYGITYEDETYYEQLDSIYAVPYGDNSIDIYTIGNFGGIWLGDPRDVVYRETMVGLEVEFNGFATNSDGTVNSYIAMAAGPNISVSDSATYGGGSSIYKSSRTGGSTSSWERVYYSTGTDSLLLGIAYNDDVWIAVGSNNTVLTSRDNGSSWTVGKGAYPGAQWNNIRYGNDTWVAVGGSQLNGSLQAATMSSPDGVNWTKINPGTKDNLDDNAYSPDLNIFVSCGSNGALVSADGD